MKLCPLGGLFDSTIQNNFGLEMKELVVLVIMDCNLASPWTFVFERQTLEKYMTLEQLRREIELDPEDRTQYLDMKVMDNPKYDGKTDDFLDGIICRDEFPLHIPVIDGKGAYMCQSGECIVATLVHHIWE